MTGGKPVWDLIDAVLALGPESRAEYLRRVCPEPTLRRQVETLIGAYENAGSFLNEPAVVAHRYVFAGQPASSWEGRRIGPYQILKTIGEGGMGVVFRAARADDHYRQQVAIKLVGSGGDTSFMLQRFRTERQILANLDHPNIARLLDGGTTEDSLPYLVMELIEGEPIDSYCDAHRLPIRERLKLFQTVCSAVQHAHQHGVIHRDLKPGNILVTEQGVPKLLDFGIAKILDPETFPQAVERTIAWLRMLTPEYASPEQVSGDAITAGSDVYSLGVVLYVLLTGRRPYPVKSRAPHQVARAICEIEPMKPSGAVSWIEPAIDSDRESALTQETISSARAEQPAQLRRTLRGDLDNIVLKSLRKEPRLRYETVQEFSEDIRRYLEGRPVLARRNSAVYRVYKALRRNASAAVLASVLVLVSVVFLIWEVRASRSANNGSVETGKMRQSVAVLGFRNLSGQPQDEWISTAISEMIATELAGGGKLRVVASENVARMKTDLSLADSPSFAADTLVRIRKNIGADYVVAGSYLDSRQSDGGTIRLDVRLQKASTGETIGTISESGNDALLPELVNRAGMDLRRRLGAVEASAAEAAGIRAALPANPESLRYYAEGLARIRAFDALSARRLLEKSIAAEPNFAQAHLALAGSWSALGYDQKAAEEAKRALDLSGGLSREDRLSVEAKYRETTHEWAKAVEAYKTLFSFFPDDLEHGLSLAKAQDKAGKGKDSMDTVAALRRLPSPMRDDPRIDLAQALAAQHLENYSVQQQASESARRKAEAIGARLLTARSLVVEAVAWRVAGRLETSVKLTESAERIYAAAGDRAGIAVALNSRGNALLDKGDVAGGQKTYEKALAIYREIGNESGAAGELLNIAAMASDAGDQMRARKLNEEALAVFRRIGDQASVAEVLLNLGGAIYLMGDQQQAMRLFQECLHIRQQLGAKDGQAAALHNIASVLMDQGNLPGAQSAYEQALALHREAGDSVRTTNPMQGLAEILALRGNLRAADVLIAEALEVCRQTNARPWLGMILLSKGNLLVQEGRLNDARQAYAEALSIENQLGEKTEASETKLGQAQMALEEGRYSEAEQLARDSVQEFEAEKEVNDLIRGRAILASALLKEKRFTEAQREIDAGHALAAKSQNHLVRTGLTLAAAPILSQSGKSAEAERLLNRVRTDSQKLGLVRFELEARAGLGEIELRSGHTRAGQLRLKGVEKEARSMGFYLIAGKVARLTGGP